VKLPASRTETALLAAIHSRAQRLPEDDAPASLLRIEPQDGAVCVFRDSPVVAHYSRPLDPASVGAETFRVWADEGVVSGRLRLSPDGSVLIWEPGAPLGSFVHHFVSSSGLRDARGREVAERLSRFLTCDLMRRDLSG
jgi:hypothetical protein